MAAFRRLLFWLHLAAGVTAGVVVLIMSVTGVLLTYQRQMQWWADTRHFHAAPAPGAERLTASAIVAAALTADPEAAPTTVTLRSDPSAPAAVAFGPKTIYVNPYTGAAYGEGTGAELRAFFAEVVVWHRYLAMSGESRPTGKAITGAANLVFLFIVLSGMYLWWPRSLTWTQIRNVTWFRRGLPSKARDFNWHNVLGFWSALPLAIVVYSGVVISYPWATNMLYYVTGDTPPPPAAAGRSGGPRPAVGVGQTADRSVGRGGVRALGSGRVGGPGTDARELQMTPRPPSKIVDVDLDRALAVAASQQPDWTILGLRVPTNATAPITIAVDRGDGGQPQLRGTLTLDPATLVATKWEGLGEQTPGRRLRSVLRFAHTGEAAGLAGQTIAGFVSAAGAVLVYTGLALSLRRFLGWRKTLTAR